MLTPTQFTYFLQGFSEICEDKPNKEQWDKIKQKIAETLGEKPALSNVFTPSFSMASKPETEIFITITNQPVWKANRTHSAFYPTTDKSILPFVDGLGVCITGKNVTVVVDNELKPKPSYSRNLITYSDSNHLTGLPETGPGICNVGLGEPSVC